jgi:hypothetical protein
MRPGMPERRTHDYKRHGTSTLFAALNIATGKVTGACKPRHRHQEFLAFLKQVARAYPDDGTGTCAAPGDGQLRRPHTRRDPRLADRQSPHPRPLHPDLRLLAQPRRGLVRHHRETSPSTAAPSARSENFAPRSAPSSTAGTTAATPSYGPSRPTTSSTKPTVRRSQTRRR